MKIYTSSWHYRFLRKMDVIPPDDSCGYVLAVVWWLVAMLLVGWLVFPVMWIAQRACRPVEFVSRRDSR